MKFSGNLARNVLSFGGQAGQRWLDALPERVEQLEALWGLADVQPFADLSFNFVAQATQAGRDVVLKIGWQDQAINRECNWLIHYGGATSDRVVPILARDGRDAYLMPKLNPGTSIDQLQDDEATSVIGSCIRAFTDVNTKSAHETDYPTVQDWFAQLERATDASRQRLGPRIERAFRISAELSQSDERRLLHGDLHHTNILRHAGHWLVTDPHGVIGDPAHECAAMLRNALETIEGDLATGLRIRVEQLASATGFDAKRIAAWGYAQNVLSCVWSLDANPNSDVSEVMSVVDTLEAMD